MSGWALRIDGFPYLLTVPGVTSVSAYPDGETPGFTVIEGALERPTGSLSERLRPTEGSCDVSSLTFVVHDVDGTLLPLFSLDDEQLVGSYLSTTYSATTTGFDPADTAPFTGLPRDAWINGECVRVNSLTGPTLSVTRGRYGSRARVIEANEDEAVLPELLLTFPGITRRRCVLYRVDADGVATERWIGHLDHAPRLNEDGVSWTLSAVHVSVRELNALLGSVAGNARTIGYDGGAAALYVERGDVAGIIGASAAVPAAGGTKVRIHESYDRLLTNLCNALGGRLTGAGATNVLVTHSTIGALTTISVTAQSIDAFTLRARIGTFEATASSVDTAGSKRAKLELYGANRGALTRFGWQPPARFPNEDGARLTVLTPSASLPTDSASWATLTSSGAVPVTVTPILTAPWDDDTRLVLDTREMVADYWDTSDTTYVEPSQATLRARAYLRPNDAAIVAAPPVPGAGTLMHNGVLVFQREYLVESSHWLYALQWVFDEGAVSSESDPRSWTWAKLAPAAAATGGGVVAAVNWRIAADRKIGEFLVDECALRGACLAVRSGRLAIVAVRQPTASETVAATITDDDLRSAPGADPDGPRAQVEQWEDGVVTAVQIASPLRDVTVVDTVARARYGDGRTLQLRAEGLRNSQGAIDDPVAWARAIAQRPLRLWSQPVRLVRLPLTAAWLDRLTLGDVIEVSVSTLPDGTGARGLLNRRVQVIGIDEDLDTGDVTVEALLFTTAYGYAPCAKVESISGAVVELAGAYASSIGDYAGSGLATYEYTAGDYGATTYAVGDVVELVERNNSSPFAPEQRTIVAVDPTIPNVTLDTAPSATWATLPWVDVRTAPYSVCVTAQRDKWAYGCSSTAPQEIVAGVPGRKWAV